MAKNIQMLLILGLGLVASTMAACPASGLTHPVQALVPAYWGIDTTNTCAPSMKGLWKRLANCGSNCVAIINPNSGPGTSAAEAQSLGAQFRPCINKLKNAGVKVLGYIATTQTSKAVADVQTEYGRYKSYYPTLDGVFFDEGTSWYAAGPGGANNDKSYYQQVAALVSGTRVLNPGGRFEPSMTDIFEIVVGFEQTAGKWAADANYHGICPIPSFTKAHTDDIFCTGPYPGAKPYVPNSFQSDTNTCSPCSAQIAALVYQTGASNYVTIVNQCASAGYSHCYVTSDGADGNPWDSLPGYFNCYTS